MISILLRIVRVLEIALLSAALWCATGLTGALAGEKMSGNALFLVTPTTKIPLGSPDDDHVVVHAAERGTQLNFSAPELFKNCSLLRTSTCDLIRGRGSCFGYHIFESPDGDRLLAKFSGMRLPDANKDKKPPEDVLRGTWVFVGGTGKFANVKGGGSYRGRYLSNSEYALEWTGEFSGGAQSGGANISKEGD